MKELKQCSCSDGYILDLTGSIADPSWNVELNLYVPAFCKKCELGKQLRKDWDNTDLVKNQIKQLRQEKINKSLKLSGVSPRFKEKRLIDLSDSPKLQAICSKYIDSWELNRKEGKGFYFSGLSGRGKTHTASAIVNELIEKYLVIPMFINLADIADRVRKSFDDDKKNDDSLLFDRLKKSELLVIDDLGTEKYTEWLEEKLFSIINFRYDNKLPTIITSNLKVSELKYNTRLISRIYEMSEQIEFTSIIDRRIQN